MVTPLKFLLNVQYKIMFVFIKTPVLICVGFSIKQMHTMYDIHCN